MSVIDPTAAGPGLPGAASAPTPPSTTPAPTSSWSPDRQLVVLRVNGVDRELLVEPRRTLVDALRHDLGLTGTHVGCEHGVCGACTVLVDGQPARSCLLFAAATEGRDVRTVEDLAARVGDGAEELSDLQQSFIDHHGLQCGFCTPGMLMLAQGLLAAEPDVGREDIREAVAGNLCRCTGYQSIVDAIEATAVARRQDQEPS